MSIPDPSSPADASPQGLVATSGDPEALCRAIDLAFDYRGDVTIEHRSAAEPLSCFIFDRRAGASMDDSIVRVMATADGRRHEIPYGEIDRLTFTGRDTAAGRSFDTWMKNYVRKKLAGERASIESEPLEEGTEGERD